MQQEIGWLVGDGDPHAAADLDQLFAHDAECLWQLGEMAQAVVALETGRILALLRQQDFAGTLMAGVCAEHAAAFDATRQRVREACLRSDPAPTQAARTALTQVLADIRGHCDPDFLPTTPTYDDIVRAAAPEQALVYLYAGDTGGMAFVVPPPFQDQRDPVAVALPQLTYAAVDSLLWRKDAGDHVIGGYMVAVRLGGTILLNAWVDIDGDAERERRMALPVGDATAHLSPTWSTLRYALGGVMAAWRMQSHGRLSMPLREALRDETFAAALNWFFLEGEIERALHDLHDAGIATLRDALDAQGLAAPDQPIALIPCGRLSALPLHAAWARRDPASGTLIPLMETCELTYQPAAHALAVTRSKADQIAGGGPVYAFAGSPPADHPLPFAAYEAEAVAALARHAGRVSLAITSAGATRQAVLDLLARARDGAVLDLATPGYIGADPNASYLHVAGDEQLSLAEIQRDQLLDGVRLLIASGCVPAGGTGDAVPAELIDAASFLQSGAAGIVTLRWPAADRAIALLMIVFLGNLLANPARSPARALREAVRWLRTAPRRQLDEWSAGGIPGVAPLPAGPEAARGLVHPWGDDSHQLIAPSNLPLDAMLLSDPPYHHPVYWAVAAICGT